MKFSLNRIKVLQLPDSKFNSFITVYRSTSDDCAISLLNYTWLSKMAHKNGYNKIYSLTLKFHLWC